MSSSLFDAVANNLVPIVISVGVSIAVWKIFGSKGGKKASASDDGEPKKVYVVGSLNELKDGEMKEVKLPDNAGSVLLTRENGVYHCTSAKCTHLMAPLAKGVLHNGRVRCPWHGACFSTRTGDIEEMPGVDNLRSFPVMIREDNQLVISASASELKTAWKRPAAVCSRNPARDERTFVIVGGGAAGFKCAETLRSEGFQGQVVLINKEPHLPYDRTKCSKALSLTTDKMLLRPASFYSGDAAIDTKLNEEVTHVDVEQRVVELASGEKITYDECFFATGGNPRMLPVEGAQLKNIFPLRTADDAHQLLDAAVAAGKQSHLAIVGSSFIGMEAAAALYEKFATVSVIGMESVPFERVLGAEIGGALQRLHETKGGIKFHMKRTVKRFLGTADGALRAVELDDGSVLDADVVVMGAGVIPATQALSEGVNKVRDQSIVADEYLCAAPHLYVGGDVARFPYHKLNDELVRIEHFGIAMFHGKIAARNMLGHLVRNRSIPYFWTSQYGKSVRYCGHALRYDNIIIDGSLESLQFVAYFCHEGTVLAAASVSRDPVVSLVAELMHTDDMLSEEQLLQEIKKHGKVTLEGRI